MYSCARLHFVFFKDITRMDSFCCTVAQDYILFFSRILYEWTHFDVQLRKITFCFFQGYYTNGLILMYSCARLHFVFFKDITRMDSFCCTVVQDYILFVSRILHEWTHFVVQLRKITFCFSKDIKQMDSF